MTRGEKQAAAVLIGVGALVVIGFLNGRPHRPPPLSLQQREAIEAQAQAEDAALDAVAAEHKVRIGMTAAQCRVAWGEPTSMHRTVTSSGMSEQWIYRWSNKTGYLYIENGILRSIQDSQ